MSIESILGTMAIVIALVVFYFIIRNWAAESKATLNEDSEEESETVNFPLA